MPIPFRFTITAACVLLLSACASTEVDKDPYEGFNRGTYAFTNAIDRVTLQPVARGYRRFVPRFMRSGVSNFYDNLLTPRSSLNNFLQGKPHRGVSEMTRFFVNTTVGIGGLVDVASATGLDAAYEDFSQTFAVWGIPAGPYIYLPFFGPHTLSDVIARPFDWGLDPINHANSSGVRDKLRVMRIIDIRAGILPAEDMMLKDAEDPYLSLREAFYQNREYQIYDGNPPPSEEDDDLFNEFFDEDGN